MFHLSSCSRNTATGMLDFFPKQREAWDFYGNWTLQSAQPVGPRSWSPSRSHQSSVLLHSMTLLSLQSDSFLWLMWKTILWSKQKKKQEHEEAEKPWEGAAAASPHDPGPLSPEYLEREQRSDTETQGTMNQSWGQQSRASLSLGYLMGPGIPSSPLLPLESHSSPPLTASTQDPVASLQAEKIHSGIPGTGTAPHCNPWEPYSASYCTSPTEENTSPLS